MGLTKEERAALGGSAYDQAYMSDGDLKAAAVFRQKAESGEITWEEANNSVNNIRSTNYGYDGGKDGSEYNYTGGGRKTGSSTGSYSGYGAQVSSIANQLMNMNYNQWKQGADYAALKEQYTQNGKMAMQDTVGDVSARTGGLASSYATTAGNQAYNQYMQTLEDAARALYNDEYNRQASNLGMLQSLDNTQYSRYRDAISDQRYDTEWKYGVAQDALQQQNWQANFDRDGTWHDEDTATSKNDTDYTRALAIAEYTKDFSGMAEFGWTENQIVNANSQANKSTTSSGGGGPRTKQTETDWSGLENWVERFGEDSAEDYIAQYYKDLGFSSKSQAVSAWKNYQLELSEKPKAEGYSTTRNVGGIKASEWDMVIHNVETLLRNGKPIEANKYLAIVGGNMSNEQQEEVDVLLDDYGY